jgi:protein TonB
MALRALVFSSDGSTTSALCHVLTDLGIEAEICSEMLVAVERVTSQAYDALLVDWDQQAEAVFLVKQLRELKLAAQALTLALVQNDEDLPKALQAGANSVIRKPIVPQQAHDTLATAKQLIAARQSEQRSKEPPAPAEPVPPPEGNFAVDDPDNVELPPQGESQKKGFLQQTAPRSAMEAAEFVANGEETPSTPATPAPAPPPVPDPSVRARALSILGYGKNEDTDENASSVTNGENEKRHAASRATAASTLSTRESETHSQDTNREFSSFPENFGQDEETPSAPATHYAFYVAAAALLIAGVLWVFAPGDSYLARLKNLHLKPAPATQAVAAPIKAEAHPATRNAAPRSEEPVLPDPALTDAQDEAASNIQVIESKPIPVAGAQQPPSSDAPPDAQAVPEPDTKTSAPDQAQAPVSADATPASHPQLQPASDTQISAAPQNPTVVPLPPAVRAPESAPGDSATSHPSVIIPDSLKNSPQAAPGGAFEPLTIPEETSRSLLVKQVDPIYPPIAIPQRIEGTVILQAYVGQDGSVRDIKLVRGYFLLGRAAFDAVRQWRFRPYVQNGRTVEFQTYITVVFKLPT